jgi:predicted PurR-regulated permease PerM
MTETARKAFVITLVAVGVIVLALALWKLRLVVALVFAGFIIAAAMRPSIDALHRHRVPRAVGLTLHYAVFAGLIALALWFAVPRALNQSRARSRTCPRRGVRSGSRQSSRRESTRTSCSACSAG